MARLAALKARLRDTPWGDALVTARAALRVGHYYSPVPNLRELRRRPEVFDVPDDVPGVDLRADAQVALVSELAAHHGLRVDRWQPGNGYFDWADATLLAAMLRWLAPRRVVEVGSGWSTAVMLDTADVDLTCIEPYPDRLRGALRDGDRVTVLESPVQDVPLDVFTRLEPGDLLFVDSTHVAKVGSDVNHLLFSVFPRLAPGVVIHVHDVFFPFEYPRHWVFNGNAYNEAYVLRALLTGNADFEILVWNSWLDRFHREETERSLPGWGRGPGSGSSLYLRKVR